MPTNSPTAIITLPGVATSEELAGLRRELVELRKVIEALVVPTADGLLDRVGAAQWLKVSVSTLDGLNLPCVKIGTSVRFRRETLENFAQEREAA